MVARILVADDDAATRDAVAEVLREEGYEVFTAADGAAAIAELAVAPDLLLTDLEMPGANGEAVIAELRRRHPHTKVIVLTAQIVLDAEREADRLGAHAFLNKPLDLDHMILQIAAVLA